jgi:hypothetical protein
MTPKTGIMKLEETPVASQLLGKHIPAATNTQKQQSNNFHCYATVV